MTGHDPRTREELEARLAELEATLDAIRHGDVDALVVEGEHGPEIYVLSTADEAYRVLVESLGEGAMTLAEDGLILYANASMGAMTGQSAEKLLGRRLAEWLGPAASGREEQTLGTILSATRPIQLQATLAQGPLDEKEAARPVRPVLLSVAPILHPGPVRVAVTATDLSDVERRHEELETLVAERTRSLEAANRELEAFAYSVSHDLRAPLRAIDGFSQALAEDTRGGLDPVAQGHIARIRAASQRMGLLIDDVLALSRLSRAPLRAEEVDVSAKAAEILRRLHEGQPDREVEVRIEPGLRAYADPVLFESVLTNLLDNAWKFTSRRERATIEVFASDTPQGRAICVRDDGVGFDPEFAGKLFTPFQRLHSDREFPGTGVGLASVKRVINRHGGEVWAQSRPGEGATFSFTLPPNPTPRSPP